MRVLVVTQYFWPESFPINLLIDGLHDTGCEITVLTGQPNYPEGKIFNGYRSFSVKKEAHQGYCILRVPLIPRGKSGGLRLLINYLSFLVSASIIGPWLLRKKKFDIVFSVAQSPILAVIPAIVIKKIKRLPLVTWVGDLWPESLVSTGFVKNKMIINQVGKLAGWIYKNNDLVLIQSRTFRQPVQRLCNTVLIEELPNPAEAFVNIMNTTKSALILDPGFNIVYAGNIGTVQSLEMIVEAAKMLSKDALVRFVMVGSGSKTEWLQQQIKIHGLKNIQLPGRFERSEVPAILQQADVLLVSLVKDVTMSLTVPSKTQTYMAAGKPIIASLDGEGARVVEEAGAGIATPAEDAVALVDAIIRLKNMQPEQRMQMGNAANVYFRENYEIGVVAKQLSVFLKNVITAKAR